MSMGPDNGAARVAGMGRSGARRLFSLLVGVSIAAYEVGAQPNDAGPGSAEPVIIDETVIVSESLKLDYESRCGVFDRNVRVIGNEVSIESDRMEIQFKEDNSIEEIKAVGKVRIVRNTTTGVCERALCDIQSGRMIMSGDARVTRGGEVLTGKTITYYRKADRLVCSDGGLTIEDESKLNDLKELE